MDNEQLHKLRHSAEHVMHQALKELFPQVHLAMGPATDEGFYNDFDPQSLKITEADFPKIEKRMQELIDLNLPITRIEVSETEARDLFKDNPYKLEWIDEFSQKGERLTVYWTGKPGEKNSMVDLCAGPHLNSTKEIGAFKLLSIAGAYWHGDEKNKMLTRIYGTAFTTKEELEKYLQDIENAKLYDHRKIGKELGLFVFSDLVGKGLPMLGPKGAAIKRELERFTVDEEIKRGYHHVSTPDLAKVDLYKTSGHYPYYKDTMYPVMKVDEEELILRPMTCPHHFMFFKSEHHSYRDLPCRIGEIAHQYRYEKSGELSGLVRLRMFCLADAHIIAAKDQAKQVIKEVLELIDFANEKFGMVKGTDYRFRLSLGDRKDTKKYYKDDAAWDYAEDILRQVLKELDAPYFEAKNEAAFYGPKIDIQVQKPGGKEETAFTVQYDFVMPTRFELTFTNKEGKEEQPIVIHRSSIGCLERTMAFLIEKFKGAFPVWLSPVQVRIIPITDKQLDYAKTIETTLKENNIRVEVDDKSETMQNKIRNAEAEHIPYMLILGGREAEAKTISLRARGEKNLGVMPTDEFLALIKADIAKKRQI